MHNMIEFGMVQAIGEGVELLMRSEYVLDMPALFHNWNHGSVVRSWLVELMEEGFREYGDLSSIEFRSRHREHVWGVPTRLMQEVPTAARPGLLGPLRVPRQAIAWRRLWRSCATSTGGHRRDAEQTEEAAWEYR
jgi:6-phosphogluconate dehydrogenase